MFSAKSPQFRRTTWARPCCCLTAVLTALLGTGGTLHAAEPPANASKDTPAPSAPAPSAPAVGPDSGSTAPGPSSSSVPSGSPLPSPSGNPPAPSASTPGALRVDDVPPAAEQVLLLRTAIVGASESGGAGTRASSRELFANAQAQKLDVLLGDAIQDLGLTLDLSNRSTQETSELTDVELVARAAKGGRWVIYPSIDARGSEQVVRLAAVAPGTKAVIVRVEVVKPADLAVRAVVMLRDVVSRRLAVPGEPGPPRTQLEPKPSFAVPARSQGRAILAFNGALFGGFVGYAVQRGSGSDDPRLLFPLMALGTGLGLGASAIVAEEWDVGIGDAWYLSAGAWWPALSGLLIAKSRREVDPPSEYGYALIGSFAGLGLATTSLAIGGSISEGGALMTHSGGAFGLVLGGLTELAIRDNGSSTTPYRGLGIGAGAGVLIAGAAARWLTVEPSRVLLIDLGAGLGGLAGAAAASPFIVKGRTEGGDRAFLLTTMGTTIAGGVVAWLWTRKSTPAPPPAKALWLPHVGVGIIAAGPPGFASGPAVGLDVSGPLP